MRDSKSLRKRASSQLFLNSISFHSYPNPSSTLVGLPRVKRDKYSVFNFLTLPEPTPPPTAPAPSEKAPQQQQQQQQQRGPDSE